MLKPLASFLTSVAMLFSVSSCAQAPASSSVASSEPAAPAPSSEVTTESPAASAGAEQQTEIISTSDGKTLVVYFSWSGNTEDMANYIAQQTGGDLLKLEPTDPYPEDYSATGDRAKIEVDTNARPEITNLPESIAEYDTILVGYPIWWHTAPMLIGTFLESYDLSGVDVYPFTQSASMDEEQFAQSMDFIRTSAANATVHDGLFCRPSDTGRIQDYLQQNGLLKG